MDAHLVARLNALNRDFYTRFAQAFSDARPVNRTNLSAIMPYLRRCVKLLDVGCGNGRLAYRLDEEGLRLRYVGVDVTPALLAIASERKHRLKQVEADFRVADICSPAWTDALREVAPFDGAVALAVLHHVPAFQLRSGIMQQVYDLLCPGGIFVLSNWQFDRSSRLRKKILPWQSIGIDERDLEPGDALLDWKRGGSGLRYCHLVSPVEMEALAGGAGFHVTRQFEADEGMNLFTVLERTA